MYKMTSDRNRRSHCFENASEFCKIATFITLGLNQIGSCGDKFYDNNEIEGNILSCVNYLGNNRVIHETENHSYHDL